VLSLLTMDDELLIETVKRFPVLYASDDISYRNSDKKEAAWQQVSSEIVIPVMLLVAHMSTFTIDIDRWDTVSKARKNAILLHSFWLCEHKLRRNYGDVHHISQVCLTVS
jgi:hypothetical protein